jgi:hypothetical protein
LPTRIRKVHKPHVPKPRAKVEAVPAEHPSAHVPPQSRQPQVLNTTVGTTRPVPTEPEEPPSSSSDESSEYYSDSDEDSDSNDISPANLPEPSDPLDKVGWTVGRAVYINRREKVSDALIVNVLGEYFNTVVKPIDEKRVSLSKALEIAKASKDADAVKKSEEQLALVTKEMEAAVVATLKHSRPEIIMK